MEKGLNFKCKLRGSNAQNALFEYDGDKAFEELEEFLESLLDKAIVSEIKVPEDYFNDVEIQNLKMLSDYCILQKDKKLTCSANSFLNSCKSTLSKFKSPLFFLARDESQQLYWVLSFKKVDSSKI